MTKNQAPIVRNFEGSARFTLARWGAPSSQFAKVQTANKRSAKLGAKGMQIDFKENSDWSRTVAATNIRNLDRKHWKRWLGVESRCIVPFTSFGEFNKAEDGDIWFALDETRPLAFLA